MKQWIDQIEARLHEISRSFWNVEKDAYDFSQRDSEGNSSDFQTELEDMFGDLMPEHGQWSVGCSSVYYTDDGDYTNLSVAWIGLGGVLRYENFECVVE